MLRLYVRLALFTAALIGAVILFAFAFSAAAVVLFIVIVVMALMGRSPRMNWWVVRPDQQWPPGQPRREELRDSPLTIDHDPNDLPNNKG